MTAELESASVSHSRIGTQGIFLQLSGHFLLEELQKNPFVAPPEMYVNTHTTLSDDIVTTVSIFLREPFIKA